jgi:hypothetical protein
LEPFSGDSFFPHNLRKLKVTLAEQILATDKLQRALLRQYFLEVEEKPK